MAYMGCHVGRIAEYGKVESYDRKALKYTVLCNCGNRFNVSVSTARRRKLACAGCLRKLQSASGTKIYNRLKGE